MKKLALFLGSGVSLDSGAPTVESLTDKVKNDPYYDHGDWNFYPRGKRDFDNSDENALKAQSLINILHEQISSHIELREHRLPNYEDYFYCLRQIVQDESHDIVNPLITLNSSRLKDAASQQYLNFHAHIDDNKFASLADRAAHLIQCVVRASLINVDSPVNLEAISQSAKYFQELDIFTLNHDLLVEKQLDGEGINYLDGFGHKEGEIALFNGSWNLKNCNVRLFKLHGSINWYLFRFKGEFDQYARVNTDPDHVKDSNGDFLGLLETLPSFLSGTTIKEQAYGHGLYGELFAQFRTRICNHRQLVVSGYGWGDKGVNTRLHQWLRDQKENKIIILHKGGEDAIRRTRFWYWKWERYYGAGKVMVVPKWLSECNAEELDSL